MTTPSRRQFLSAAVAAGAATTLGASAGAIEPIRRTGRPRMRLSLAAYSYRRYLALNRQPRTEMTLADFINTAAGMPVDAVELTEYYFPPETTPAYLAGLKGRCTRLGLDVSGTAIRSDFCLPAADQLRAQIDHVKRWVEHTSRLGGKTVRIFGGSVARGDTEERARARCVASIQEACDHAAQYGILLALENHGGITGNIEQMLALVREIRHDFFGVNLDTGNFRTADPYPDLARLAPYAIVVQVKTEMHRPGGQAVPADLPRLIEMLRSVNYRGYVALEHEANEDPREAVPRHIETLRRLING